MKTLWKIFVAGLIPLSTCFGMDIVKDGKSEYRIVVAPNALAVTNAAALDVQTYIRKVSGAELPMVKTGVTDGNPSIVVGDCAAARDAGIRADELKPESFVIKTSGDNLYIVGKDLIVPGGNTDAYADHWRNAPQSGTWFGVAEFLERFLDVRWFMPGDVGEYFPERKSISIGNLDISDGPGMEYRYIGYLVWSMMDKNRRVDVQKWERRNRNGWSVVYQASHTWVENFRADDYYKEHPDWFALVDGRRLAQAPLGLQACTTNPGFLDKFSEIIIKKCKESGGIMFSLTPNDGDNHCECENCRKLDFGKKRPDGGPVMTNRYVTYCNEIAKRVNKVLPDQKFGFLPYGYYMFPPTGDITLDPHVIPMFVFNSIGVSGYSENTNCYDAYIDMLLKWSKLTNKIYFYTHPNGNGVLTLPCMHQPVIKRLYQGLVKAGVAGVSLNLPEPFESSALNNYLYIKMAWNPKADIDALYEDALGKCYGEAAAPFVRKYFDALNEGYSVFVTKNKGIKLDEDSPYDGLQAKCMPYLKKAIEQPVDKNQKIRIQMLIDNLNYCDDTLNLYRLSRKLVGSNPSKTDALKAMDLTEKRKAYLDDLVKRGHLKAGQVEDVEKNDNLPLQAGVFQAIIKNIEGGASKAFAERFNNEMQLDGKFDKDMWKNIPFIKVDADKNTGETTGSGASAKIAYDKDKVYISVKCDEDKMDEIKDACVEPGGKVWQENDVEIFFDTDNTQKSYRQICVNSLGTISAYEGNIKNDGGEDIIKWESGAKAVVFKGDKYWSVEVEIPIKSLNATGIKLGTMWGFNICRGRVTVVPPEYTCWSPTFGGFHKPERFGKLIFR